jgi:CubicO group peptidase (beta-lactamase class C family)
MRPVLAFLFVFFSASILKAQTSYFPPASGNWETIQPSELNWCQEPIDDLYSFLETEQTKSFIVLKDGKIVLEQYFGTYTQDSLWFWFSAGKTLRAMLVGIAQEDGLLSIDDKTSDHLGTGWTSMPQQQEDSITIWHQLTMTTGLDEADFECTDPSCLVYSAPAGSRWFYHNAPYSLLKNVLESASSQTLNQYTNTSIKNPIGMGSGFWLGVGYNTFYISKARDMARFGILVQNNGSWDGQTILGDTDYINDMLNTSQPLNPSYGYLWWLNGKPSYIPPGLSFSISGALAPDAPTDVVTAIGSQGQYISFSPSSGLMVIRQGGSNSNDLAAVTLLNNIWERVGQLECSVGISEVQTQTERTEIDRFNSYGQRVDKTYNGIQIIRYQDGSTRKLLPLTH